MAKTSAPFPLTCIPILIGYYFVSCLAVNLSNFTDHSALLVFKSSLDLGSRNILDKKWSSTINMCDWMRVACSSRHQRVTALDLRDMGLSGTIPPEIGNLSFLVYLNLSNNYFHGQLPNEFGHLRRLKYLTVRQNNLTGEIPRTIGNLTILEELYLCQNKLRGEIPKEIGNLHNLRILNLKENMLTGEIPRVFGKLAVLEWLSFYKNKLGGEIPQEIGNLSNLRTLDLEDNMLTGGIPRTIGNLTMLNSLSFYKNKLGGEILQEIGNLRNLERLYLGVNVLTGKIPHEISNLRNLQALNLEVNMLTGPIPPSIFNISELRKFGAAENYLSGSLPSNLGVSLTNLEALSLGDNNIVGAFPSSISNASKLTWLDVIGNSLNGYVPDSLGSLKLLRILNIGFNNLRTEPSAGGIKFLTSLTNCRYLKRLVIASNPLNGFLPASLGNLSRSLEYIYASDCKLKGSIPFGFGNLSNLVYLMLSGNELVGPIPETFGRLSNLQRLQLFSNNLEGYIPTDLCHLRNLGELCLTHNMLRGSIPTCLGNLTMLRYLYLGSNRLISTIPLSIYGLTDLLVLNLSSNLLNGDLKVGIKTMKDITNIDLSRNQFTSHIPSTMGELQNLVILYLAQNRLHGPIPPSLGNLIGLEELDLSYNDFSGEIPKTLEGLLYLKSLNVSFNALQGEIPHDGPFENCTALSFKGNKELCGASRLQVLPCTRTTTPNAMMCILKYVVPSAITVLLLLTLTYCSIRHPRRNKDVHEINLLGKGSFASVYKGILSNETLVAVKVFDFQNHGIFKSFEVESEVTRKIRHRNLVKVITCVATLDFKALVLEYMPNGSLEKWLYSHSHFLNVLQRLNIMIDVGCALQYLHHEQTTPIVHCDLKPNNVLLDEDMVAHVNDFGIAKLLATSESTIQTRTLATFGYMAPEYGTDGIVSTSGDVYSYGILIMETFTRKKPTDKIFSGDMNLKQWVNDSLKSSIMKVLDANLLKMEDKDYNAKVQCISSILGLAMNCSNQFPEKRMDIKEALATLQKIRIKFVTNIGRT